MALTRAQLLMGNVSDGAILSGQPQGVRPGGAGIDIATDGTISVDSQSIVGVMKMGQTAGAAAAAYNGYTWPSGPGAPGQQLETNGAGVLGWADADGIDWTAKGQLIVGTGVASDILLNAGAVTSLLVSDPASPSGLNYTDSIRTAMQAPAGTTIQRPLGAVAGQIRFNEDTDKFEFYTGSIWEEIASGNPLPGNNTFVKESIPLSPAEKGNALIPFGSTAQRQTVPVPVVGSTRFNTVFQQLEVWDGVAWGQLPASDIYDFVFQTRPPAGKTASAIIPPGPTGQEETVGVTGGWMRYNTTANQLEFFNGTSWELVAPSGGGVTSFVQAGTPVASNTGDIWYNTTLQRESVWDGSAWVQPGVTQTDPTGAALLPTGPLGGRPGVPSNGMFRLSTTSGKLEIYTAGVWEQVASADPTTGTFVAQTVPTTGTASAVIPSGNTAGRQTVPAPVGGYIRFNTDTTLMEVFDGLIWTPVGAPPNAGLGLDLSGVTPNQILKVSISQQSVPPAVGTLAPEAINGSLYWDDTLGQLFIRYINGGAPTWVAAAPAGSSAIPAGTRMVFAQASAPTGWTQDTTAALNDSALRLVNTAGGGTGGSVAFTTAFASGLSSASHTLSIGEIPSHDHVMQNKFAYTAPPPGGTGFLADGGGGIFVGAPSTNATGGSGGHSHSLPDFAVKYVDLIIAAKN